MIAALAGFPVVSLLLLNRYDIIGLETWRDTTRNKERLVRLSERSQAPRLLAIGGSGVFYGIDASLLSERLGLPCYNLGTHAGFGLEYHIRRAKRLLRAGDIAFLAPEYRVYTTPESQLSDLQWGYFFTHDKANILQLNDPIQIARLLFLAPPNAYETSIRNWSRLLNGDLEKHRFTSPSNHEAIFMSSHGDMRFFQYEPVQPPPRKPVTAIPFPAETRAVLSGFRDWCKRRNVRLIVTLPNTLIQTPGCRELEAAAATVLKEMDELDIATIGSFNDATFPLPFFYDTLYHPNGAGRRIRTELLARALRASLKCASTLPRDTPTEIVVLAGAQDPTEPSGNYGKFNNAEYRLWTPEPASHPSQIDPCTLKAALASRIPVFTLDSAAAAMINSAGFRTERVEHHAHSPTDLLERATRKVVYFALTPSEATAWCRDPALEKRLSLRPDQHNIGIHSGSNPGLLDLVIRSDPKTCSFEDHAGPHAEAGSRPAFHRLEAHGNKIQNALAIQIDRYRVEATVGGLVVVFDPSLRLIESVHHSQDGELFVESLYRVAP